MVDEPVHPGPGECGGASCIDILCLWAGLRLTRETEWSGKTGPRIKTQHTASASFWLRAPINTTRVHGLPSSQLSVCLPATHSYLDHRLLASKLQELHKLSWIIPVTVGSLLESISRQIRYMVSNIFDQVAVDRLAGERRTSSFVF